MYTARKNVDLFVRHGIYTEEEICARAEIHIENYAAVLTIEARTMAEMLRRQILPAASDYGAELCRRAYQKDSLGVPCSYERDTAAELAALTDDLHLSRVQMERDLEDLPEDPTRAMVYCHDVLEPHMEEARRLSDRLETLVPGDRWPIPVYADLLFSV